MSNDQGHLGDWPGSRPFWRGRRVMVTGGNGFLGRFIVGKLRERGAAEIIVPRGKDYDSRDTNAIRRLFQDATGKSEIGNPAPLQKGQNRNAKAPGHQAARLFRKTRCVSPRIGQAL